MQLSINDLTFSYDGHRSVLDRVSLTYESPDIYCILGSNGQGKSTLLQCIVGAFQATAGNVCIDGEPASSYSIREMARKIAYIPQNHTPSFAYPVIDVVTMGRTAHMGFWANPSEEDRAAALDQLTYLGIERLAETPYTNISGGERQLVMIAAALAQQPELIIFDEPTAHLDFGNQYKFLELVEKLRSSGIGVLMTTHFPDHALALDGTCAILRDGKIRAVGQAADIITEEAMSSLYDIEVNVRHIGDRSICIPGPIHGE